MPAGSKRGLVAPQNTFLENIIRKTTQNDKNCGFLLANSELLHWPIVYANETFCNITGFSRSDLSTESCQCEFMHGRLTDKNVVEKMKQDLDNKSKSDFELLLYNKQGFPIWFYIQLATVNNEEDVNVFFLLTFKDITSYKNPVNDHSGLRSSRLSHFVHSFKQNKESYSDEKLDIEPDEIVQDKKSKTSHRSSMALPKYHPEAPHTPRHIILHYSTFKTFWDWTILFLTIYTAVIVPYNVVFAVGVDRSFGFWLISDSAVDIIFLLDIIINFITTFVGPSGEVVSDLKVIHMNYVKGWFSIDLLSCLPYDLINFFFAQSDGVTEEGISSLFSILKVARLLRLGRVVRKLDHYIEYGGSTLCLLVCFFGLSGHWLACIWYAIASSQLINEDGELVSYNWLVIFAEHIKQPYSVENKQIVKSPEPSDLYVASLYFTMTTLTSVGFGNIAASSVAEQIFCVVVLIFGALLYASIFGNVTTIIQQMYADTNRYHNTLKSVREFLKLYRIPENLSDRIMDYIVFTWSLSKGIDTPRILNYFPKDMKADICVHLNRKVFNKHHAFRLASDSCLRALAVEFSTVHNAPGDMIYHQGESVDSLIFVTSGSLEVLMDDQVVAILSKGDVFGDTFWENELPGHSSCHVRALTYCDLNSIKWGALTQVLSFYEAFARSFRKTMRLTFNLRKRHFFRKLSDVKAEEALNRTKSPKWEKDLSNNQAVRKLFKKYKNKSEDKSSSNTLANGGLAKKMKDLGSFSDADVSSARSDEELSSSFVRKILSDNETSLRSMSKDISRLLSAVENLTAIVEKQNTTRQSGDCNLEATEDDCS